MKKKTVVCVVGTRPEAIKMAPVIIALREKPCFDVKVLATGQHEAMLSQALGFFKIKEDHNLSIMRDRQSLDHITASVLTGAGAYFDEVSPDAVLVHGDTTTTFASALAAFYRKIPVGHVEAGLRSGDMALPFPEEMNRVLADRITRWSFAPTPQARENLLREGTPDANIWVTGNTVIDALLFTVRNTKKPTTPELAPVLDGRLFLLATMHRRESWGRPLENVCAALADILEQNPHLHVVIPMHKNPAVREVIVGRLGDKPQVTLCDPLDYPDFVWCMNASQFILSDSGGVQEEATAIRKPVLILRSVTERPEAVEHGSGLLVGTDSDRIMDEASKLLRDPAYYAAIGEKCAASPFGDGTAARKIADALEKNLLCGATHA